MKNSRIYRLLQGELLGELFQELVESTRGHDRGESS